FLALCERHVSEDELSDDVIRTRCLQLRLQRIRNGAWRTSEGQSIRRHFVEAGWPALYGLLAIAFEQLKEARMPSRKRTGRKLLRLAVGLADDDETTDPHASALPSAACRGLVEALRNLCSRGRFG